MKIFVSTGEVSGDLHLSYLVKQVKKIEKDVQFFGVAGKYSEREGVKIIQKIDEIAVMGFAEAIRKYKFFKNKAEEYIKFIKMEEIEKVILVDYGGFNLYFLKLLKREIKNIKVYYYIPPKLWIWGKKRINKLKLADYLMVIFPWEVKFYKEYNIEAKYFGNPFSEKYSFIKERGEDILLLPGSRKQEIISLMPELIKLLKKEKSKKFILKLSSKEHKKWIEENLEKYDNLEIIEEGNLEEVVKKCKIAIAASGTVTLELALLGVPTIVIYKTTKLNYFIAKYILNIGLVSLPNLTLSEEVFPELLQQNCTAEKIEKSMIDILSNLPQINKKMEEIRKKLSGENVTKKYAEFLLKGK